LESLEGRYGDCRSITSRTEVVLFDVLQTVRSLRIRRSRGLATPIYAYCGSWKLGARAALCKRLGASG
jgi:hypothetical protein